MRIAITGPSGSGKTKLANELARVAGLRMIEIDALHHGPNWKSCGPDVLRERVSAATEGDDWVTDSTYHSMLGPFLTDRADVIVWLDLPVPLVLYRLMRRTHHRKKHKTVLWNGNLEPGWRESLKYLIVPAVKTAFANRRKFPQRFARYETVHRLRSDREVREFVQSIQASASTSGNSNGSDRQKTPPLPET